MAAKLISAAKEVFAREPRVALDYLEIVDPDTLDPVERISQTTLVAVAAYVGSTRLIDNIVIDPLSPRVGVNAVKTEAMTGTLWTKVSYLEAGHPTIPNFLLTL